MDDNNESVNTKQKDPCGDSITMVTYKTVTATNDPATTADETDTDLAVNKMDSDQMYETITTDETDTDPACGTPTDNKIHLDTVFETTTAIDPVYGIASYVHTTYKMDIDPVYTSAYLHNY